MEPVKFFYAADLRLDKPLKLGEGSGVFAPRARDVAYEATRRLIDCALSCAVDFVFLRGELCGVHHGFKALLFLADQTMRLSRAGIACYILNEGSSIDSGWADVFPLGVRRLNGTDIVTCANRSFSVSELTDYALMGTEPVPLQGLTPDEGGACGAWLVSLPDAGGPEREFAELSALRWERRELDVSAIETEEDLAVCWRAVKDSLRGHGGLAQPILLHLKLTGVIKERSLFYGENLIRGPEFLMNKLNADEINMKNFILLDSLEDDTVSEGVKGSYAVRTDFLNEVAFFKSGLDMRVGLFEALKERGLLQPVSDGGAASAVAAPISAASLLENMTDADVESLLRESCDMADRLLFKNAAAQEKQEK